MKNEIKILIHVDTQKMSQWETEVEMCQSEANRLLNAFHAFQPWKRITTLDEFILLVTNPLDLYDKTLQKNSGVNLELTAGRLPAPDQVAKLLDLDRDNFINIVKGQKVTEGCKPCNAKAKILKTGSGVLSYGSFKQFEKYLIWNGETFDINETEVDLKKESFNYYAETPAQIECYHFWTNLCSTLNSLPEKNYCGDLIPFQSLLKNRVMFIYGMNKLVLDQQSLLFEIQSINNK